MSDLRLTVATDRQDITSRLVEDIETLAAEIDAALRNEQSTITLTVDEGVVIIPVRHVRYVRILDIAARSGETG